MSINKQYASQADYDNDDYAGKLFLFRLAKYNPNPSYTNANGEKQHYPATQKVLLEDEIVDGKGKDKKRRSIRYAPGVQSIFVDKHNKDIDLVRRTATVVFLNGTFALESDNKLLVDMMMKMNKNGANKNRIIDKRKKIEYYFEDVGKKYEALEEADDTDFEAKTWLKDAEWDDIYGYARILFGEGIVGADEKLVKYQMRNRIKANAKTFLEGLKDPSNNRKQAVLKAIDEDYLVVNKSNNTLCWADNPNSPLVTAPIGADVIDHFIKGSYTTQGEMVYDAIEKYLASGYDPDEVKVEEEVIINNVPIPTLPKKVAEPQLNIPHTNKKEAEELMNDCIEAEIFDVAGPWYSLGDNKYKGKKELLENIQGNRALYELCKLELQKFIQIQNN